MFDVLRIKRRDGCRDLAFDDLNFAFAGTVSSTKEGGCLWYLAEILIWDRYGGYAVEVAV